MAKTFIGIFIITLLSILGKLIENTRNLGVMGNSNIGTTSTDLRTFYHIFNIHLNLSLGMLGLAWTANFQSDITIVLVIFLLLGVVSKGVFSRHVPESWKFQDRDMRYGLYFPNGCGLASVIFLLLMKAIT